MASGRVPNTLPEFDVYIKTSINFLTAGSPNNGTRLGLSAAEITKAQSFLTLWYTGNPASPGAYELHGNPNTKTKGTREQVVKIMKDFTVFISPLLTRMSASASVTRNDLLVLNIAPPNASRTRRREAISEQVYFTTQPLGGGDVRFSCRTNHDTKRASKAEGADSIQVAFKAGEPAPLTASDSSMKHENFTRSVFTIRAGQTVVGQKLYVFARWYNTKHPELAGPWSPLAQVTLA